jgi:hypothetical protein
VEPWVDANPTDPNNLIAVWQQDRWSNGGARGLLTASTHDGGATWATTFPHFSRCAGGTDANGGNYERSSDPWVSFSPNGDAHQISLSVNMVNDPATAILVSKSTDGGDTWSEPITLARDPSDEPPFLFNDKESITADPNDANYVYAIWDRLRFPSDRANFNAQHAFSFRGDAIFSRTTDGGATWEPPRAIFAPRELKSTIGHQIVVRPTGELVDLFTLFQGSGNNRPGSSLAMMRSTDKGATWSAPQVVHKIQFEGAFDPDTGRPIRAEGSCPRWPSTGATATSTPPGRTSASAGSTRSPSRCPRTAAMRGRSRSRSARPRPAPTRRTSRRGCRPCTCPTTGRSRWPTTTSGSTRPRPGCPPTTGWSTANPSGTTTCADADDWGDEQRLTDTSFDVEQLPFARGPFGYFVGEYEGLTSTGNTFWPLFAIGTGNRLTDIVTATAGP